MSQRPLGTEPILLDNAVRLRPATAVDSGTCERDVIARAEIRLLPKPGLALIADDTPFRLDSAKEPWTLVQPKTSGELFDVTPQPSPSSPPEDRLRQFFEIFEATGHETASRQSTADAREPTRWNLVFLPRRAPIVVERRREAARRLELEILNFPVFDGDATKAVQLPGGIYRIGHLAVEAAPWKIELTERPGLGSVRAELNASRGFATTHEARIDRADGGPIEKEEALRLLEALDRFLSFTRGVGCATAVVRAFSGDDAVVWEQWGCRRVAPWRPEPDSWFDLEHGRTLAEAFSAFLRTWETGHDKRAALREAIYWYLTGHWENSRVDGGLILLQAAMERLAHTFYRPKRWKGKESETSAQWLRMALEYAGVPLETPASFEALSAFVDGLRCPKGEKRDAVFAMTRARNNAIHPRKETEVAGSLYFQAWTLARGFVELMVLSAIGYQGSFANRLREGRVELVPWAQTKKLQSETTHGAE